MLFRSAVHTRERYRLPRLAARVAGAGLEIDRATYANAFLFPAAIASRFARKGVNHRPRGSWPAPEEAASDVRPASAVVQAVGAATLTAESVLLRHSDLPFGLSAIVVATRPMDAV